MAALRSLAAQPPSTVPSLLLLPIAATLLPLGCIPLSSPSSRDRDPKRTHVFTALSLLSTTPVWQGYRQDLQSSWSETARQFHLATHRLLRIPEDDDRALQLTMRQAAPILTESPRYAELKPTRLSCVRVVEDPANPGKQLTLGTCLRTSSPLATARC